MTFIGIISESKVFENIKESLKEYLYQKTKRNPMILPIIMEV